MRNFAAAVSVGFFVSASAFAAVQPFPASFGTENVVTNGTQIYVRVGGAGPAVLLLHGYGETGDMWAPLAAQLVRDHTVIGRTCAASGCPRGRPAVTTRRPKRRTWPGCSIR